MFRNMFKRTFEQNKPQNLSPRIQSIVRGTAKEFLKRHRTTDPVLQRKVLELAHATLHMRIYQRIGPQSDEVLTIAHSELASRIVSGRPAPHEPGSTANPALAT
jgi:hypothetical protein